jgi:hypothetical protein
VQVRTVDVVVVTVYRRQGWKNLVARSRMWERVFDQRKCLTRRRMSPQREIQRGPTDQAAVSWRKTFWQELLSEAAQMARKADCVLLA